MINRTFFANFQTKRYHVARPEIHHWPNNLFRFGQMKISWKLVTNIFRKLLTTRTISISYPIRWHHKKGTKNTDSFSLDTFHVFCCRSYYIIDTSLGKIVFIVHLKIQSVHSARLSPIQSTFQMFRLSLIFSDHIEILRHEHFQGQWFQSFATSEVISTKKCHVFKRLLRVQSSRKIIEAEMI